MEISVIIPVFNSAEYLEKCLTSLLKQSYKNFGIIAVDDGSTDNSLDILEKYKDKFKNFVILKQPHKGSAAARNHALSYVSSKYISFIDSDDFVHPDFFNTLVSAIQRKDIDIVQCNILKVNEFSINSSVNKNKNIKILNKYTFLNKFCISTNSINMTSLCNKLYKAELFKAIEFDESCAYDDEQVVHQIYYRCKNVALINTQLYYYYMSDNSQMRKAADFDILNAVDVVDRQINFFESKGEHKLSKLLLLKYYITIFTVLNEVKTNFPNNHEIIDTLIAKSKDWKKALFVFGPKLADKLYLIKIANSD